MRWTVDRGGFQIGKRCAREDRPRKARILAEARDGFFFRSSELKGDFLKAEHVAP